MGRSVFVIDTPKDCLHCKMRRVIYCEKSDKGYQNCGLNHDGYKLESFFKEEDLKPGWISPKCPLISKQDIILDFLQFVSDNADREEFGFVDGWALSDLIILATEYQKGE